MKDIEKIKSEDLGCQVQDANPGNFAIEQEVAQLVGATVPAPTEPSADDARELGAQLLVFLRRALLPIRSALRTAVAAIYAHLDSRCTDYTPAAYDPFRLPAGPYDPMRPLTPRTLPNLLTALTAFSDRKISNGGAPNDGIPDGISLAHLLCSTDAANAVTEIVDDNTGWTKADSSMPNLMQMFPNLQRLLLGLSSMKDANICAAPNIELPELTEITAGGLMNNVANNGIVVSISLPKLKTIYGGGLIRGTNIRVLNCPELEYARCYRVYQRNADLYLCSSNPSLEEVYMPKLTYLQDTNFNGISGFCDCSKLKLWQVGKLEFFSIATGFFFGNVTSLIHFEIGAGTAISLNLQYWSPTNALDASRTDLIEQGSTAENNLQQFLQNFREHIALRLTANGTGLTLTLSQAVRNAIHAAESTYGIENIIVTQKGWTISPAPGASSQ